MKNIKKLKSYGKAVAGSALLVGATLTGAAGLAAAQSGSSGQATLHDYPTPFVDDEGNVDTSIVVGTDGKQADVVSALDIAGDLGNSAFEETTVSGGSSAAVDGETEDELTIGQDALQVTADASDYTAFTRETVEDDDGNDVFVTESATATVDSRINGTTTDLDVSSGDISYSVQYSPGFGEGDDITLMGEEYELVNIVDDSEVELGSTMERTLTVGDDYDHGPYTVEVTGKTSGDSPKAVVRISDGEETIETQSLDTDGTIELDNDQEVDDTAFSVEATSVIFYEDGTSEVQLESTVQDTTLEEGEDLPMDDMYEVNTIETTNDDGNVTSITVQNTFQTVDDPEDEDEVERPEAGEGFEGPAGLFTVSNQGLTSESMSEIEFSDEQEVTFDDPNAQEQTVDFAEDVANGAAVSENDVMAVTGDDKGSDGNSDHYTLEVTDVSSDSTEVTVEHADFEKDFVATDSDTSVADVTAGSNNDNYIAADDKNLDDASNIASGDNVDVHYQSVSTGYGFDVVVEWIDSDGSSSSVSIEEVNVYGEGYTAPTSADVDNSGAAAGTTFTVQGGAEISQTTGDSGSNSVPGSTGIVDGTDSGYNDYLEVDETPGVQNAGDSGAVRVWYEEESESSASDTFNDADDGEIGAIYVTKGAADSSGTTSAVGYGDVEDGDSGLSLFGSELELDSASSASVMYPDDERYQVLSLGSEDSSGSTGDAVSMMPTGFPSGTGTLDEDVSNSERDQNMILVGGPEVNGLTADLASEGETWNSTQYENNQGVGVLDLVNDAFSDGYSALVVAGWQAEDTSAAADYLVDYNPETDTALEGKTTAQVNTDSGELVE